MTLSTHVLDVEAGRPVSGVPVRAERADGPRWQPAGEGQTGADGRTGDLVPPAAWGPGRWRMIFETGACHGPAAFYPRVTVEFVVGDPAGHHHLPLLLSRHGYTTYRGS